MIAIGTYFKGALIAKFNSSTGEVSDALEIEKTPSYGVCFSPDNSYLYVNSAAANSHILQFNVSRFDSVEVVSSRTVIDSIGSGTTILKLYNDKIYHTVFNTKYVGRINHPNRKSDSSEYDPEAIELASVIIGELPNDVAYPLFPDTTSQVALDTAFCAKPGTQFIIKGDPSFTQFLWDDGSSTSERKITSSGTYWVLNKDSCHLKVDTFIIKMDILITPLINVNGFVLGTQQTYNSYQWLLDGNPIPEATDSIYEVKANGVYKVAVIDENGCIDTSDAYTINNYPVNVKDVAGFNQQINVYPNPTTRGIHINSSVPVDVTINSIEGKQLLKPGSTTYITLESLPSGIYFLLISDIEGNLIKTEKIIKK